MYVLYYMHICVRVCVLVSENTIKYIQIAIFQAIFHQLKISQFQTIAPSTKNHHGKVKAKETK